MASALEAEPVVATRGTVAVGRPLGKLPPGVVNTAPHPPHTLGRGVSTLGDCSARGSQGPGWVAGLTSKPREAASRSEPAKLV